MPAERLAEKVLNSLFPAEKPSYPINPFEIINRFGVVYQFMEFEKLEGIYCIPDKKKADLPGMCSKTISFIMRIGWKDLIWMMMWLLR